MKLFQLISLTLILAHQPSFAAETISNESVYDENETVDTALTVLADAASEPQLSATPEDLVRAKVVIVVNKSAIGSTAQTIRVYVDGTLTYEWKTSTGREKVEVAKSGRTYLTTTPVGYFRPTKLEVNHYSQTWKANMPHAIFFVGGIALHASTHVELLGKRASGGCVRLAPENAKTLFTLVRALEKKSVTLINRNGKDAVDAKSNPLTTLNRDVLIILENHI